MSAGTKVKTLEVGKEEIIDGIKSNWVKVEIISGKDINGKELKIRILCPDGLIYLSMISLEP